MTEIESGESDWSIGEAVVVRVSDELSEELARQDRSRRFPVSRDRPPVPQPPPVQSLEKISTRKHQRFG